MTTMPLHTLLIPQGDFLWGATALSPGARSVAPRSPPEQIHSPGKQSFAMDQNLLFLGVSETPKNDPQGGFHEKADVKGRRGGQPFLGPTTHWTGFHSHSVGSDL